MDLSDYENILMMRKITADPQAAGLRSCRKSIPAWPPVCFCVLK
jgi:hypothetical protein